MQRQTQLANDIWPLLLPRIQAMIAAAASGSGGGSGAVNLAAHDLGGSLHKGTLRNDQAPQFLMLDGSRPLAGSLAVDAGVTIDGVDISAHAADINAHHAKLHAITDAANHSVTGSQYQIVGLTAVNTLGLLTPKSSPVANEIVKTDGSSAVTLVDLTVTSDLFMTGTLDFGTNTIAEDATYLQFAGSKALRFAQNIGNANWTLYNAGGYTTTGSISITGTAGDLDIGAHILFVNQAYGNVGIKCAPDSQFALDINGPARAQYFIGPHALQLPDAAMICHFDGAAPYNTNYNGIALGHKGQIGTYGTGVIFRPGKFGKAIQIAEATTNLITNPSFETGTSGWSTLAGAGQARTTVKSYFGGYSMGFDGSGGTTAIGYNIAVTNGTTYTLSAWVYMTAGTSLKMDLNDKSYEVEQTLTVKNSWQRMVMTFTPNASATITIRFFTTTGAVAFIDGVQLEAKAYCTPYCDGSLGNGHAWTGTAHASTSTRPAAALYYGSNAVDAREGTVSAWVRVDGLYNWNRLFHFANSDGDFDYIVASTGAATFRYNSTSISAGTLAALTWHHVAVTWSRETGTIAAYLDGAQIATASISSTATIDASYIYVGTKWATSPINGLIDDFAILSTANDANQIRAIYESDAPVFAESSTVSWVATPGGLLWADAEGLWMKDTSGNPVFGIYGGESYKNWGGFDMYPGDLLIGRSMVGVTGSAILWDQSAGTFGFYGAGNATAQVQIATDGSLTAGGGNVALNADGAYILSGSSIDNFTQSFAFKTAHGGTGDIVSSFQGYVLGDGSDNGGVRVGRLEAGHDASVFAVANTLNGDLSTGTFGSVNTGGSNYRALIVTTADGSTAQMQAYIDANVVATVNSKGVNGKTLYSSGDSGGVASTVGITNNVSGTSTGTGTVKMNGATPRNSSGWLKIYSGTNAYYIPLFSTIDG